MALFELLKKLFDKLRDANREKASTSQEDRLELDAAERGLDGGKKLREVGNDGARLFLRRVLTHGDEIMVPAREEPPDVPGVRAQRVV